MAIWSNGKTGVSYALNRGPIPRIATMAKYIPKVCSRCKTIIEGTTTSGFYLAASNGATFRITRDEKDNDMAYAMLMGGAGSWQKVATSDEKVICDNCF